MLDFAEQNILHILFFLSCSTYEPTEEVEPLALCLGLAG